LHGTRLIYDLFPDPLHDLHGSAHKSDLVSRPVPAQFQHISVPVTNIDPWPLHALQRILFDIFTPYYYYSFAYDKNIQFFIAKKLNK